jgi:hypothetical protein
MRLGRVVDNWLDVAFYAAYVFFDPSVALRCEDRGGSWDLNTTSAFGFFGTNHTTLVSLTSTLFAVTDGYDVEYHHHGRRGGIRPGHAVWPIPINVSYGVAAVAYARDMARDTVTSGHTTALFGCSCVDDITLGVQLVCAVVPYEVFDGVGASSFIVNVTWEVANTPKRLACRDTKIAIESIRHATTRFTSPNEFQFGSRIVPPVSCFTQETCTTVDAAIWIMPVCPVYWAPGLPPGENSACVNGLRDFSCFPFCLALHRSFSANEPLLVRASSTWEDTVLLSARDCVFERAVPEAAKGNTLSSANVFAEEDPAQESVGTWMLGTKRPVPNLESGAGERVKFRDPAPLSESDWRKRCVFDPRAVSSVPDLKERLYNSSRMFQDLHAFAKGWEHANDEAGDLYRFAPTVAMLTEQQPLVFAGDFALRTVTYCDDAKLWNGDERDYNSQGGTCNVVLDVLRVSGSEHNEFQLLHAVPAGMSVTRRPNTIAKTGEVLREGSVTLPPVVVRSVYMHNPATVSLDAVWYAVNPDYEMVHCLLRYCSGFRQLVNCLQFSVLTNYERLRIWKLVPFAGCERTPQGPTCPPHAATSVYIDNPPFNLVFEHSAAFDVGAFCDPLREYDLFVEAMEEFDPLNIAVTVRRGNAAGLYQELWGGGGPATVQARVRTVYYFVHTQTLQIREARPWTAVPVIPHDEDLFICDSLRFMPSLGSAVAEAFSAGLFALKTLVRVVFGIANIADVYSHLHDRCGLQGLGHSVYRECGTQVFDLTEMFDAMHRGNVHAWEVLDSVARVFAFTFDTDATAYLTTFMAGARNYQVGANAMCNRPTPRQGGCALTLKCVRICTGARKTEWCCHTCV